MEFLKKYQNLIAQNIKNHQFEENPLELYQPINYIIANGGKRLRPILSLMATEAFGGTINEAIKPALAVEFFHNFTLIHDDIMDDAPLRRNKPTIHALHGTNVGILSGDALLIKSYQFFEDLEPILFKKCLQLFSETGIKICEGQQMDINFEKEENISFEDYILMITYKTGVLSAAALKIGAMIARASQKDAEAIYQFGKHIGIAFQIIDDYLDIFGNQTNFGKRQAGDIHENKKTILYLIALKNANNTEKQELLKWYNQKETSLEKVERVTQIFRQTKADKEVLDLVKKYNDLAIKFLHQTSLNEDKKNMFIHLANYLLKRTI